MIDPPFWSRWWSSSSPPQRSPSLRRCDSVSTWWKGGDVSHQWDLTRTQDANQKLHNVQHLTARLWRNFCKTAKHKMRENHHAVLFCLFSALFQFCILCTCLCLSMSMSRSGVLLMPESGVFFMSDMNWLHGKWVEQINWLSKLWDCHLKVSTDIWRNQGMGCMMIEYVDGVGDKHISWYNTHSHGHWHRTLPCHCIIVCQPSILPPYDPLSLL